MINYPQKKILIAVRERRLNQLPALAKGTS